MKKLISMVDFITESTKNAPLEDYHQVNETFVNKVIAYAGFLKQPLTLGMFVPVDEDGEFLTAPTYFVDGDKVEFQQRELEYEKAKYRVLFEGFVVSENNHNVTITNGRTSILFSIRNWIKDIDTNQRIKTIEDLANCELVLTETAKKQIFGTA